MGRKLTLGSARKHLESDSNLTVDLKPCPFCGGKGRLSLRIDAGWKPYCANCRCQLGVFPSSELALGAWNMRN